MANMTVFARDERKVTAHIYTSDDDDPFAVLRIETQKDQINIHVDSAQDLDFIAQQVVAAVTDAKKHARG